MKHPDILKQLTLEQKVALLSGKDVWSTYAFPQAGVPSMVMSDGPHGLRRQLGRGGPSGPAAQPAGHLLPHRRLPGGELGPSAAGGGRPRPGHGGRRPGGAYAPGAGDEPEAQPPGGPEL